MPRLAVIAVVISAGQLMLTGGALPRVHAGTPPPGLVIGGPPGVVVSSIAPSPAALFYERLTLEDRTAFDVKFTNQTGQTLTFTGATAFLVDDDGGLIGTVGIDADTFAATRRISGVSGLFTDGRVLTNLTSSETEGARDLGYDALGFVAAGVGRHLSGDQRIALVRYTPDGAEDGFGGSGKVLADVTDSLNEAAEALAFDSLGRLVVAGVAEPAAGQSQLLVARFLPNGSFDPSFNGTGWRIVPVGSHAHATAVALDNQGRIVAGGRATVAGSERFALIRLLDDGTLDPTFGAGGVVTANLGSQAERLEALAVDGDGRLVTAGRGTIFDSVVFVVARYLSTGALDPAFGIGGATLTTFPGALAASANALVIAPSGRIVVGGEGVINDRSVMAIARYNVDGTLDANFDGDGRVLVDLTELGGGLSLAIEPVTGGYARSVALDAIGRIVLAGPAFTTHGSRMAVVRLNGIGQLDPSLGGDGAAFVPFDNMPDADASRVLTYPDDTIVLGGVAFSADDGGYFAVARLEPNGTRYSVLEPKTSIPHGAGIALPFPFNDFPRKQTPVTINIRVFFAEYLQPLFISGIEPIFFEQNARPFRFPLRDPSVGYWRPSQGHDVDENHYGSASQRYAYDLSVLDPATGSATRADCDVKALAGQYANDPLYEYDIDPDAGYTAGDFAECALAYGEGIYAIASGTVVYARDGSPNNFPVGTKLPELYLDASDPAKIPGGGNAVVINHGNHEFSFYAHMRPGSVQVVKGQQVVTGQLLGAVGNSGSSSGTHLHFHVVDNFVPAPYGPPGLAQPKGPAPTQGTGLPVYFYDVAFPAGSDEPLRQLRSGINRGTLLTMSPEPVPMFDLPAPEFGPGLVNEVEPNQTLPNAQRLRLPVQVDGTVLTTEAASFADGGDAIEDLYRFRLANSATIVARLSFPPGADLDLLLTNVLLHPWKPQLGTRLHNPEVVIAYLPAGTHYAFVSRFDGGGPAAAPYTLEIEEFGGSLVAFFDQLPQHLWKTAGHRSSTLEQVKQLTTIQDVRVFDQASRRLRQLATRVDGCLTSGRPDANDSVIDCDAQRQAHELIDRLLRDLDPSSRESDPGPRQR